MINSNTETEISFRFNRLDKLQAITLEREIIGTSCEEHLDNNCYVAFVPLTENNFDDINDYYIRQRLMIDNCDIFVSVSSYSGTQVLDIPPIVNRMLKYIDCKLSFSFTVLQEI